jgi:hypothetical protein
MSKGRKQSAAKEAYWRCHFDRQAASGFSIRTYCLEHDLAESSFHWWRRETQNRDAERETLFRPSKTGASTHPRGAGLVAINVVDDLPESLMPSATFEIEYPGGPVVRLREDVSAEVLHRVLATCRQIERADLIGSNDRGRAC